jgi:hypothetical protein
MVCSPARTARSSVIRPPLLMFVVAHGLPPAETRTRARTPSPAPASRGCRGVGRPSIAIVLAEALLRRCEIGKARQPHGSKNLSREKLHSRAMVPVIWRRVSPLLCRYRVVLYMATLLFLPGLFVIALSSISADSVPNGWAALTFCACMFGSMVAAGLLVSAAYFDPSSTDNEIESGQSALNLLARAGEKAFAWGISFALLLWFGLAAMFMVPVVNAIRS